MPSVFTLEGAEMPVVVGLSPQRAIGDATAYLKQFPPAVGFGMALGLSIVTGLAVGSLMVWGIKRTGYQPRT